MIEKDVIIQKHNQEQFERLLFALKKRNKGAVAILIYETENYRKYLYQNLKEKLPEYENYDIDIAEKVVTSLHRYLKEVLPAAITQTTSIRHLVHIFHVAKHLLTFEQGEIKTSSFTQQLNFERELLFRDIPCILLFWMDKNTFIQLQKAAPDFTDWITYIFDFQTPSGEKTEPILSYIEKLPPQGVESAILKRVHELRIKLDTINQSLPKQRLWKEEKDIHYLLGQLLPKANQPALAIQHLHKALYLAQKMEESSLEQSNIYFELGDIYVQIRAFAKALDCYHKVQIFQNEERKGVVHHQLGKLYREKRQWLKAIQHYETAIVWYHKTKNLYGLGEACQQIGVIYHIQKKWELALSSYQQAIEWEQKSNNHRALHAVYRLLGFLFQQKKEYTNAVKWYIKALENVLLYQNDRYLELSIHSLQVLLQEQKAFLPHTLLIQAMSLIEHTQEYMLKSL